MKFHLFYLLLSTTVALSCGEVFATTGDGGSSPDAQNPDSPRTTRLIGAFSPDRIRAASLHAKEELEELIGRKERLSQEAETATVDVHSPTAQQIAKRAQKAVLGLEISRQEQAVLERVRVKLEARTGGIVREQMRKEREEKEARSRDLIARLIENMSRLTTELSEKKALILEHEEKAEENRAALQVSADRLEELDRRRVELEAALALDGEQNDITRTELEKIKTKLEKEQKTRVVLQGMTDTLTQALAQAQEHYGADIRRLTKQLTKEGTDQIRLRIELETEQTLSRMLADGVGHVTGEGPEELPDVDFEGEDD